jgi:hypothetical protein
VPHYSFAGYAASVRVRPDLVVVPWIPADDTPGTVALRDWLREHATSETMLLTICGGSWTAAQAGLLDGYTATSHQNILPMVTSGYPDTTWISGRRWAPDRNVVSSAGITAALDATLHVIGETVGRDVAEDVARHLGYPHLDFIDDPRYDVPARDKRLRHLNLAFRWERTHIGLVLYDGVGEIEVASIVDLHPRTHNNVVHPLTLGNDIVETRHGLHLVARRDVAGLDRIVLPGRADPQVRRSTQAWAIRTGLPVETVHGDGFAFDTALRDTAEHSSSAEAQLVAAGAEYPAQLPATAGSDWPSKLIVRPLLLGAAGIAAASAVGAARRRRQTRPSPS